MKYIRFGNIVVDVSRFSCFEKEEEMEFVPDTTSTFPPRRRPNGKYKIKGTLVRPLVDTTYSSTSYDGKRRPDYKYEITVTTNLTNEQADTYLDCIVSTGNNTISV